MLRQRAFRPASRGVYCSRAARATRLECSAAGQACDGLITAVPPVPPLPLASAVEKILIHDSLIGDKLNGLVKALQDAGGWRTVGRHACPTPASHLATRALHVLAVHPSTPPLSPYAGVTLHGGERAASVLSLPAAASVRIEYSSLDATVELVSSQGEAIDHIHAHGSGHTECIITGKQQPGGWVGGWREGGREGGSGDCLLCAQARCIGGQGNASPDQQPALAPCVLSCRGPGGGR